MLDGAYYLGLHNIRNSELVSFQVAAALVVLPLQGNPVLHPQHNALPWPIHAANTNNLAKDSNGHTTSLKNVTRVVALRNANRHSCVAWCVRVCGWRCVWGCFEWVVGGCVLSQIDIAIRRNFVLGCTDWSKERTAVKLNHGIALEWWYIHRFNNVSVTSRVSNIQKHEEWLTLIYNHTALFECAAACSLVSGRASGWLSRILRETLLSPV